MSAKTVNRNREKSKKQLFLQVGYFEYILNGRDHFMRSVLPFAPMILSSALFENLCALTTSGIVNSPCPSIFIFLPPLIIPFAFIESGVTSELASKAASFLILTISYGSLCMFVNPRFGTRRGRGILPP